MKDDILGVLILGAFGVCGLLIGYLGTGCLEYKKYSKELEKELDDLLNQYGRGINVRDETIEHLIDIIHQENPKLGKEIRNRFRRINFTVVKDEEA